jgi:hypothetical protein
VIEILKEISLFRPPISWLMGIFGRKSDLGANYPFARPWQGFLLKVLGLGDWHLKEVS